MQAEWKNWCRLCATNEALIKLDSVQELTRILQKYFCITLSPYKDMPEVICRDCCQFVRKLDTFAEKCLRADKMFIDCVLQTVQLLDNGTTDFRSNYGLEEFTKFTSIIPTVDQSTDTSDLVQDEPEKATDSMDTQIKRRKRAPPKSKKAVTHDLPVDAVSEPQIKTEALEELSIDSAENYADNDSNYPEEDENDNKDLSFELSFLDDVKNEELTDDEDEKPLKTMATRPKRVTRTRKETKVINEGTDDSDFESDKEEKCTIFNFDCHICEEKMQTFSALTKHCMEDHETTPRLECVCGKIVTTRSTMNAHRKLHNEGSKVLLNCKLCDKNYNRQSAYEHHMQTKHAEDGTAVFQCHKCPKSFTTEKKVKLHENVHLPDDEKMVHPCPYCEKRFTKLVNVQTHIRAIHIGDRPFICEECGKSFGTKGALKEHQITHSEDRPFQCSHCPKKFKNLPRLKTHEDTHNATIYVCPHCGLQLNTKRTLKMHMVVHSDQKKYKCQYCGNEYKRSKALKNHLILHTGLRPYLCPFCDKTFANGSNCRSHKKKAHPIELAQLEASGEQSRATNIPKLEQLQRKVLSPDEPTPPMRMSDPYHDPTAKWSSPPPTNSTPMTANTSPHAHHLLLQQQMQLQQSGGGDIGAMIQLATTAAGGSTHDTNHVLHLATPNLGLIHTNDM